MLTTRSRVVESVSFAEYLKYLSKIIKENRAPAKKAAFDSYNCGAFLQDNFPITTSAPLEQLHTLLSSTRFLNFSSRHTEGDTRLLFFELKPTTSIRNDRIMVQVCAVSEDKRQSVFSSLNPHINYEGHETIITFHGGHNRSYEFARGIAAVLSTLNKNRITLAVPQCHVENRLRLLGRAITPPTDSQISPAR